MGTNQPNQPAAAVYAITPLCESTTATKVQVWPVKMSEKSAFDGTCSSSCCIYMYQYDGCVLGDSITVLLADGMVMLAPIVQRTSIYSGYIKLNFSIQCSMRRRAAVCTYYVGIQHRLTWSFVAANSAAHLRAAAQVVITPRVINSCSTALQMETQWPQKFTQLRCSCFANHRPLLQPSSTSQLEWLFLVYPICCVRM